jgi:hypothetical protein
MTQQSKGLRPTQSLVKEMFHFGLVKNQNKTCFGYWMSPLDKGFSANLSVILSAYHANSNVIIYAKTDTNKRWSGSSGNHICKVDAIVLKK